MGPNPAASGVCDLEEFKVERQWQHFVLFFCVTMFICDSQLDKVMEKPQSKGNVLENEM